jgi:RNA recognition motif-containing protein
MSSGRILVTFFDLRAAFRMRRSIFGAGRYTWTIQFARAPKITNSQPVPNTGTIIIFRMKKETTVDDVWREFERFGDIREIRAAPERKGGQRFVEFWDVRAAGNARAEMGGKVVCGARIKIDFSRPGGFRKHPDAFLENRAPIVAYNSKREQCRIQTPTKITFQRST